MVCESRRCRAHARGAGRERAREEEGRTEEDQGSRGGCYGESNGSAGAGQDECEFGAAWAEWREAEGGQQGVERGSW